MEVDHGERLFNAEAQRRGGRREREGEFLATKATKGTKEEKGKTVSNRLIFCQRKNRVPIIGKTGKTGFQ
ncbi:MAG: hypothetical protein IK066_00825 [Kiritimatiellae bacterium]|nr:hypothetical protein [Kiritimatiellia bacterium]